MCMIDACDERVTRINSGEYRVARKEHRCMECRRPIAAGERYHYETFVSDGRFADHKTCAHCMIARAWLSAECGGWAYGMVREDIEEHAEGGGYGFGVKFLAVGMARKWKRKDGRPWPIPRLPKTTHQKMETA